MIKKKIVTHACNTDMQLEGMKVIVVLEYKDEYYGSKKEKKLSSEIAGRMVSLAKHYFNDVEEYDHSDAEDALWEMNDCIDCIYDDKGICPYCGEKQN